MATPPQVQANSKQSAHRIAKEVMARQRRPLPETPDSAGGSWENPDESEDYEKPLPPTPQKRSRNQEKTKAAQGANPVYYNRPLPEVPKSAEDTKVVPAARKPVTSPTEKAGNAKPIRSARDMKLPEIPKEQPSSGLGKTQQAPSGQQAIGSAFLKAPWRPLPKTPDSSGQESAEEEEYADTEIPLRKEVPRPRPRTQKDPTYYDAPPSTKSSAHSVAEEDCWSEDEEHMYSPADGTAPDYLQLRASMVGEILYPTMMTFLQLYLVPKMPTASGRNVRFLFGRSIKPFPKYAGNYGSE